MNIFDHIPDNLANEIKQHIRDGTLRGASGWSSSKADEDTITGDLFGNLRTGWRSTDGHRWRFSNRKLRGRGSNDEEKVVGADGFFRVEVEDDNSGHVYTKAILFQSKKNWTGRDNSLKRQCEKMESITPGNSVAIDYQRDRYSVVESREVIRGDGDRKRVDQSSVISLDDFIIDKFLSCLIGTEMIHYDIANRMLVGAGEFPIRIRIKHVIGLHLRR